MPEAPSAASQHPGRNLSVAALSRVAVTAVAALLVSCENVSQIAPLPRQHSYPSTFIGDLATVDGIGRFATGTGQPVAPLARDASAPRLASKARAVFFVRKSSTLKCATELWEVPTNGGAAKQVTILTGLASPLAVTPDGSEIAYAWSECTAGDSQMLSVLNLSTGSRVELSQQYSGAIFAAWSPNDHDLAVSVPMPPFAAPQLFVAHDPFDGHSPTPVSIACPNARPVCEQSAPSYSLNGELTYIAGISPVVDRPCEVSRCASVTYTVATVTGSASVPVTSVSGLWRSPGYGLPSLSADSAPGALLFTVTDLSGSIATYVWTRATGSRNEPAPVLEAQW